MTEPTMCETDCGRTTRDNTPMCDRCFTDLQKWLVKIPDLFAELDTTIAQLAVIGERVGPRTGGRPLPVNLHAADVRRTALQAIRSWSERFDQFVPPPLVTIGPQCWDWECKHQVCQAMRAERRTQRLTTIRQACKTIEAQLAGLRVDPRITELHQVIGRACQAVRAEVDRPADKVYAGPCWKPLRPCDCPGHQKTNEHLDGCPGLCNTELYTKPGAAHATCPACGTRYDVKERRAWLLAAANDKLWPAWEIAQALPNLIGKDINRQTLHSWRRRKRLIPKGWALDGTELYRVGDVIDLAVNLPSRETVTA